MGERQRRSGRLPSTAEEGGTDSPGEKLPEAQNSPKLATVNRYPRHTQHAEFKDTARSHFFWLLEHSHFT